MGNFSLRVKLVWPKPFYIYFVEGEVELAHSTSLQCPSVIYWTGFFMTPTTEEEEAAGRSPRKLFAHMCRRNPARSLALTL